MAKIARDAFLYLPPQPPGQRFAQCGTCILFDDSADRCGILGDTTVTADMSCGLYIHGSPHRQPHRAVYKPADVGLVDRQVRCENCVASDGQGNCKLYQQLNAKLPDMFDLDEKIDAQACCNAQTPKPGRADARLDRASAIMDSLLTKLGRADAREYPVKIELELTQWDGLDRFLGFLRYIKNSAASGHSFEIGADCDADEGEMLGKQKVGAKAWIDGDGADKIGRILVNGQELK